MSQGIGKGVRGRILDALMVRVSVLPCDLALSRIIAMECRCPPYLHVGGMIKLDAPPSAGTCHAQEGGRLSWFLDGHIRINHQIHVALR